MHSLPMIAVQDVQRSSLWYRTFLDCENDHDSNEFDRILFKDNVLLMLHHLAGEEHGLENPKQGSAGTGFLIWIFVDDIGEFFLKAKELDIPVIVQPHRNPLAGWNEFTVQDPDGYRIALASW